MKKFVMGLLIVCLISSSFAFAFAKEDDENEIFLAQTVDLNSDEVTVRSLTFDEMVEEVAIKTGKSEDDVVNEFINTKAVELRTSTKTAKEATRANVLNMLKANSYITINIGAFPMLQNIYRPKGLAIYGEGEILGQDHTRMTKILNVVFDRNNAISPYSLVKQFDGNVYVNLEANDRIYYSVDGDFYNTGTTSFNDSVSVGVGESVNVGFSVSTSSSYFAYINHNGRWYG